MDEEIIIGPEEEVVRADFEEVVESEVELVGVEKVIEAEETVESVEVELAEDIDIEINETVGWIGGDSTRHYSLYGREEPNQHPIEAITGLRNELDEIEALKVVYSNEKDQANYYLWQDENSAQENRVGYFVAVSADVNKVRICTENDDIFGVVVNTAAFIGGQSDLARDYKYALVAHNGIVVVRCESDVNVGDAVVANNYGYAKKSDSGYGYKVVELQNIHEMSFATIYLDISAKQFDVLGETIRLSEDRLSAAERNIIAAINMANEAHNKVTNLDSNMVELDKVVTDKANEALDKANEAIANSSDTQLQTQKAIEASTQAKAIAESAIVTSEAIRQEAVKTANDALINVNGLIDELKPITTWEYSDPSTGEVYEGAEYLAVYIKDGLATKAEIQTVETLTHNNTSAIEKNAEGFQSFVASIDRYSVGEYSQAYGLTLNQAQSILDIGIMYIPTESHSEEYAYINQEQVFSQNFTETYYYTWGGDYWIESASPSVVFSSTEPVGGSILKYWYINSNSAPDGYEAHSLYCWDDEQRQWVKMNTLSGNVNNRIMSITQQNANEAKTEVVNARGSAVSLNARITDAESEIHNIASWTLDDEGERYNLATIQQKADDANASVSIVVSEKDGEKVINTASIVTAINNGESSVVIEGDHIVLNGATTNGNGTFSISADGHMTATGGDIGGFTIGTSSIYNTKTSYNSSTDGVYLGIDGIGLGKGKFYVTKAGALTCTSGSIGGWTISGSSLYNGTNAMNSKTKGTYIGTNGIRQYENDNAYVDIKNGIITARGADIKGTITATGGTFTNCSIGKTCKIDGSLISGGLVSKNILNWTESEVQSDTPSYGYIAYNNELEHASYDGSLSSGNGWEIHNRGDDEYMRSWLSFDHYSGNGGSENDAYRIELGTMVHPRYSEEDDYYYYGLSIDNGNIETASLSSAFRAKKDMIISATELTLGSPNGFLTGFWEAANPITVLSDVNAKNSIETMPNAYSTFFDNLKPVIYKYNEGTSNRYHTGFIAQDVKSALDIAGINTVDFAGLCIPVDSSQAWTLRYEEFVSLNTYEIQKLKAEVKELKAQLEELINKN